MSETTDFTQAYSQASDAFTKFVPGFEFLQGLVKNAGKALPSMGQWVAPTLDPAELERRIEELKTVQFWLEQNARMLGATIQALEVQRMTLGTLKGMNVSLGDLSEALKMRVPDMFTGMAAAAESAAQSATASARPAAAPAPAPEAPSPSASDDGAAAGAGPVDAMQWWGALTQQFTQLASQAIQATSDAARQASEATSDAANQASQAVQAATAAAAEAAAEAAKPMTDAVNEAVSQSTKAVKAAKAATAAPAASPAKPRAAARKSTARAKPAEAAAAPKAARRRTS